MEGLHLLSLALCTMSKAYYTTVWPPSEKVRQSKSSQCYVIITCRTLIWSLMTVISTLVIIAAVMSPLWLVGPEYHLAIQENQNAERHPTIGLYNRCTKVRTFDSHYTDLCAPFVEGFDMLDKNWSNFWKTSVIFFGLGLFLMIITIINAILGFCIQSFCKKSLFTISGLLQGIAGLFFIVAIFMYPAGWGTERVQDQCGRAAGPFVMDKCSLGLGFYLAVGGTVLTLLSAMLSMQAEVSTSSDKVQDEILKGKNLICLC